MRHRSQTWCTQRRHGTRLVDFCLYFIPPQQNTWLDWTERLPLGTAKQASASVVPRNITDTYVQQLSGQVCG